MLFKTHTLTPQQLFLTDSLGALVSAVSLGVVLVHFEPFIGMPPSILLPLAVIAGIFFVSSLLGYLKKIQPWQTHLKAVAVANLLYCLLTASLVVWVRDQLTIMGIFYFVGEIAIISTLASIEWNVANNNKA